MSDSWDSAGLFQPMFHSMYKYATIPVKDDLPKYTEWPKAWGGSGELFEP